MFRIISVFSLFLGLTCTSCSDDSDLNGGMAPDNGSENSANSSLLEGIEKYANLPIEDNGKATFGAFMYKATDVTVKNDIDNSGYYTNPVLPGFYPDPSICRVGKDYYLINSTFAYFPGIPIFHSTDLVHWNQIGSVLNRPSQLPFADNIEMSSGVFAPDIKYNPHNKKFYVITCGVFAGGTYFVTCDDPKKGNWSDPVFLNGIGGIDPSFFFDDDGKAYIVHNDDPDPGQSLYDGHKVIRVHEFDYNTNTVKEGGIVAINGGADISAKPIWVEGPHLYKMKGKYYMIAAEGGTGSWHSEIAFVADSPMGEYKPCNINPILTQRDLDYNRENAVNSTGHADIVETENGEMFAVFLGVREYKSGHSNCGRETFMLPVKWDEENDQPVILESGKVLPVQVPLSEEQKMLSASNTQPYIDFYAPSSLWSDNKLSEQALFIRIPDQFYTITDNGLVITPKDVEITERKSPAFIGRRQTSSQFVAETMLSFIPKSRNDFAGLAVYQDEQSNIILGKTIDADGNQVMMVKARSKNQVKNAYLDNIPVDKQDKWVQLRVEMDAKDGTYNFYYRYAGDDDWISLRYPINATMLSTGTVGGFTGCVIGAYACKKNNG